MMVRLFFGTYLFLVATLIFVQFALGPIIDKVAKIYLREAITEYNRQLARGAFHTLELDLLRVPPERWKERIIELQPQFGYLIQLSSLTETPFSQEQIQQLQAGQIVVENDGELLYHRLGDSNHILRKGPFSPLEPQMGAFNLIIWLAVSAVMGIITFICIIPYWRQLRRMSAAALAFGNGCFDTRVSISTVSNLAPLAHAFNTMAARIEQLIDSHKELTNAVSHELRTPLSRLRFGLEMLETASDQDKRVYYVRELQTDVGELDELVNELLTYARFERERPELRLIEHHLTPFLHQVIDESLSEDLLLRTHLLLKLDHRSVKARFDAKYLARALGNLLQNGSHHAASRLEIVVERDGDDCRIHVDDDGPGIPEDQRRKIFAPFIRLDRSRSRASGGYGLGLAIVSRILEWHKGTATATASPLGGVRITLSWPAYHQQEHS
jgi:signal transduction histidine kinase